MARLFVAIRPPPGALQELVSLGEEIPGVRWTPADKLHLTLRFLAGASPSQVQEALRGILVRPFDLAVARFEFFPSRRNPTVVAGGLSMIRGLKILHGAVNTALEGIGIAPESRAFRPHITVARCKNPTPEMIASIVEAATLSGRPFVVEEFHLFESSLSQSGARHALLESYPLR